MKATNLSVFTITAIVISLSIEGFSKNSNPGGNLPVPSADLAITCPGNQTEAACQTQSAIDTKFANWLSSVSTSGGCDVSVSSNAGSAPNSCGGIVTVTFTATSSCDPSVSCSAVFSVTAAPPITLTCPANQTEAACQTQSSIDTKFSTWLSTVSYVGGCSASLSNDNSGSPSACGGSKTVHFTVTSHCEPNVTCSAVFSVQQAPVIVVTCPTNSTMAACQNQASVDAAYNSWLTSVSYSGGCNASISNNSSSAPSVCGGSTTVMWTVTSTCEGPHTCTSAFTVTNAPPVNLNCPPNKVENTGQTQAVIDSKFAAWLITVSFTGGCQTSLSNDNSGAPPNTGGSTTVTWTVTSSCEAPTTCSASFTVEDPNSTEDPHLFDDIYLHTDHFSNQAWLHISFLQNQEYRIGLFNSAGQQLWNHRSTAKTEIVSIDFNNFGKGIYFLEFSVGNARKVFRLPVF
ncbi:MAG: T9SS type A sorting domain-containing protein [Saprospiraceae bacterium]|nr:T9SS type A sorting domain-containing protein [Saprospiraceae bacterium]